MTKAWMSLFGLLGIVTGSCLGFAMNRSDSGIAVPAIWPGPSFKPDRRASMEMFLNGKIHAADVDNILRGTDSRKLTRETKNKEEKCSSCPEDSRRIRRSDEIIHNKNNSNPSEVKESTIVSSTSSEPKIRISDVSSSEPKKSEVTSSTSEPKYSNVTSSTSELKISVVTSSEPKISEFTSNISSNLTSNDASSDLTSNVTSDGSSDVTSDVASEFTSEVTSEKISNSAVPRNVVLLLVENNGPDEKATWKNFGAAHDFAVQKFLQNCRNTEFPEGSKFLLSEPLVSGRKDDCDCDRLLRENVGSLLSWARDIKEMATGAVSTTNFTINSAYGFERLPRQLTKDVEDNDEVNDLKQDPRRPRADLKAKNWRSIEMQKQSSLSGSIPTSVADSAIKLDGVNGYDGMWDVLDMFTRIRMAFFRILLESLGNMRGPENDISGRTPIIVKPNAVELVSDTVRELKSVVIEEGFVMVVAAPATELSAVVQILQSEVSAEDTLLVVAGMCSEGNEPVPFFANGPGAKALQEAKTIWDVPKSIESAVTNGCHGDICKKKSREDSHVLSTLDLLSKPLQHKRVVRAKEDEESISPTPDDKTSKDTEETESSSEESTSATQDIEKRSGAPISRIDNVAAILGIVTSITATLALNS